eukprot:229653_1
MFYSGAWYKNSDEQEGILKDKLNELLQHKQELDHQQRHQTETILSREATSAGDDEQFIRENQKRLNEVNAKISVLSNAMDQMGFEFNLSPNQARDIQKPMGPLKPIFMNPTDALHGAHPTALSTEAIQSAIQQFSSNFNGQPMLTPSTLKFPSFVDLQPTIKDANNNMIHFAPRIHSSHFDRRKGDFINTLHQQYEAELQVFRTRRNQRLRCEVHNRIYHVDPDMTPKERYKKTDHVPLSGNHGHYVEHIWVQTIDDALQTYIEGDVLELAEGRHVVSGKYKIYGTLTVRGIASSNWKTLIENQSDSEHFIWCIGKASRVTFENVLLRSWGAHLGIVRVSLRAQFIARKVVFHCGGLEGICLENESKLWLDGCVLLNSVGAGIHVNTGCKCLLTQSTIVNCGEGDHQLMHGQGAIVIYGTDINYAEHLVRKTPSLRFPSMDNVPIMVLDPDATLASMLRGRTYLYVQECKIKSNFGFGISFEVTSAFQPLPVPSIASMMDVSITVRETHFTENSFGNMGKIPAHWIQHTKDEQMTVFNNIKRINPTLFGPVHDVVTADEDDDDDEEMKDDASNHHNHMDRIPPEYSPHSAQIMPLTEQALRARNESDEFQSDGSSIRIIQRAIASATDDEEVLALDKSNESLSGLRSNRSKSEPPVTSNTPKKSSNTRHSEENTDAYHKHLSLEAIHDVVDPEPMDNEIASENASNSIKLSDKREQEFSLGSNVSETIVKMRQTRRTLRLSAPPPPTTLLSASASAPPDHETPDPGPAIEIQQQTQRESKDNKSKEEMDADDDEDVDIALDSTVSTPCHDEDTNSDEEEKPLRRSSRIKDKQDKLEKLDQFEPKQTKAAYEVTNNAPKMKRSIQRRSGRVSLPIAKTKKQIKSKKRRRCTRNRSKSYAHHAHKHNDDEDDKENDFLDGSPAKRRRLNDQTKSNKRCAVVDDDPNPDDYPNNTYQIAIANETEMRSRMRFPRRQELQSENENEDDDMNMKDCNTHSELRRSTRKASMRATKNLSNLMKRSSRKSISKAVVLSQNAAAHATKKNRSQRKRRHSAIKR